MSKREYRSTVRCARDGCREHTTFHYDRRADQHDGDKYRRESPWRCTRHTNPEQMLGVDTLAREVVLVASKVRSSYVPDRFLDGLFWMPEGAKSGSGFAYGPGFKAFAGDFPEGTRLVVTARIELAAEGLSSTDTGGGS